MTTIEDALRGPVASLIGGTPVEGEGAEIALIDPATEEQLTSYRDGGMSVAEGALAAAEDGGAAWRSFDPATRGAVLARAAALIRDEGERLAATESRAAGIPITDARAHVAKVAGFFDYYAGWADKIDGRVITGAGGRMTLVDRVPLGTVVQITPWNAPIFTAGWQLAPALAAGNAAVLKPSEHTPVTSLMLGHLLLEAGVPPGAISIVAGLGATAGARLVGDPRCGKAVFIGSVPTGRKVAATAAASGRPALLELGGKSAAVVFADADLDRAVAAQLGGIFGAAGQSCTAGSRLLVERTIYDTVVARMAEGAKNWRVGPPSDPTTRMGPLFSADRLNAVSAAIESAQDAGARLVAGGARPEGLPDERGYYIAPTVFADVAPEHALAREEIFGPVLAITPFETEAQAIALANGGEFDLAGAVWSRDGARALRVARAIRAGTVWVNDYRTLGVQAPFGGMRGSGFGRSSAAEVLAEYTQSKAIWLDPEG
ncbi:MAG: aldehyde dehydrogenase family protein [Pseudomonadota bacterium]